MKYIFFVLCLSMVTLQLDAAHFQSNVCVVPSGEPNEYWVHISIQKINDQDGSAELLAAPIVRCAVGNSPLFECGSEEEADYTRIEISIPEDTADKTLHTTILLQENHKVIYQSDTNFAL